MPELYLSRMVLDLRSRKVQRDLADCYEMHRTVLSLFGPKAGTSGGDGRILYRVEATPAAVHPFVILQSSTPPVWTALPERYLLQSAENPSSKRIDHLLARLQASTTLRFRLRANPTRKIMAPRPDGSPRPARVDLRGHDRLLRWIERKADEGGFELLQVGVQNDRPATPNVRWRSSGREQGTRRTNGRAERLTFASVTFDGHLLVRDPRRFTETLRQGIGSGKGFGFGLLSVAPRERW